MVARTASVHPRNASRKRSGSIAMNTARKVSWLGIPFGRARNVENQSSLLRPNCSISTKLSAPHTVAHTAMVRMSPRSCSLRRSTLGSGTSRMILTSL